MKRILKFALISAVLLTAACRSEKTTTFTVTGQIENIEGDYLLLFFKSNLDGSTTTIAVDTLKNGRFELSASAETGVQYHVIAPHVGIFPSMALDFYAEPGASINIQGQDYLTKNWTIKSKVKEQKIYQSYFDEVDELFKELQLLELQCRKEGRSGDYLNLNKPYQANIDSIQLNWLKKQKQISEPWMDLMLLAVKGARHYNEKDNLKQLQELWKEVDDGYKTSIKGKNISNILYPDGEPLKVGDAFPYEIEVSDLNGEIRTLTEFEGKAMLLYFSSYSCKPCVAAKKELDSMISSGDCSVEVVGLNLDTEAVWKSRGKDNPVLWHDFNDLKGSYGFNKRFKTQGIPTFVIVSKEGKILDIWAGHRDGIIAERIESVL
mgnify:FL=1